MKHTHSPLIGAHTLLKHWVDRSARYEIAENRLLHQQAPAVDPEQQAGPDPGAGGGPSGPESGPRQSQAPERGQSNRAQKNVSSMQDSYGHIFSDTLHNLREPVSYTATKAFEWTALPMTSTLAYGAGKIPLAGKLVSVPHEWAVDKIRQGADIPLTITEGAVRSAEDIIWGLAGSVTPSQHTTEGVRNTFERTREVISVGIGAPFRAAVDAMKGFYTNVLTPFASGAANVARTGFSLAFTPPGAYVTVPTIALGALMGYATGNPLAIFDVLKGIGGWMYSSWASVSSLPMF